MKEKMNMADDKAQDSSSESDEDEQKRAAVKNPNHLSV
jgi:hypothetical protein